LMVDGILAYRGVDYTRPADALGDPSNTDPAYIIANSGTAQLRNYAASPFIAVASDFGVPRLNIALGLSAPFGGGASWSKSTVLTSEQEAAHPGASDGPQRWWSIDSSLKVIYFTLAGSYKVHKRLSFGLSVNYASASIDTVRARNTDGSDDLVDPVTGALKEGRSYLSAKGGALSVGAGVLWRPAKGVRVGYSYQSSPGFGEDLRLKGELSPLVSNQPAPAEPTSVEFLQALPDVHRLGASWRINKRWEARLFGDYVRWSLFKRQCVVQEEGDPCEIDANDVARSAVTLNIARAWQDAWGVRGGVSYWLTPAVETYAGAGYDGNAAPDAGADPSLFDMDKYSAALGARVTLLDGALRLSATYTQVFYETRTIEVVRDASGAPTNGFKSISKGPSAAGTYEQAVSVGNLNAEYRF
ncbi:MAG: hypothetical protein FJ138_10525, partial [Deltaproteobacteria bacterium]|nr:hypothetical protein [Deltaproteobacteria bacterium]